MKVARIFKMWHVNLKSGLYFSKVARKLWKGACNVCHPLLFCSLYRTKDVFTHHYDNFPKHPSMKIRFFILIQSFSSLLLLKAAPGPHKKTGPHNPDLFLLFNHSLFLYFSISYFSISPPLSPYRTFFVWPPSGRLPVRCPGVFCTFETTSLLGDGYSFDSNNTSGSCKLLPITDRVR